MTTVTTKLSLADFRRRLSENLDQYALDLLPEGSFARWAYEHKSWPAIRRSYTPEEADRAECEKWGLTPEEWVEQMQIVRYATAHDMKLDMVREGFF